MQTRRNEPKFAKMAAERCRSPMDAPAVPASMFAPEPSSPGAARRASAAAARLHGGFDSDGSEDGETLNGEPELDLTSKVGPGGRGQALGSPEEEEEDLGFGVRTGCWGQRCLRATGGARASGSESRPPPARATPPGCLGVCVFWGPPRDPPTPNPTWEGAPRLQALAAAARLLPFLG